MSGAASGDAEVALVRSLAECLGVPVLPEHLPEVAASWRLMRPHLERVRAIDLTPAEEPAALFRA